MSLAAEQVYANLQSIDAATPPSTVDDASGPAVSLEARCPKCGDELPPTARYCPGCAAPVFGFVYVTQCGNDNLYKIGMTSNFKRRHGELKTLMPVKISKRQIIPTF
jgi:predicted amidophosphoribosyltransferase